MKDAVTQTHTFDSTNTANKAGLKKMTVMRTIAKIKSKLGALVLLAYPMSVIVMFVVVGLASGTSDKAQAPHTVEKSISTNR